MIAKNSRRDFLRTTATASAAVAAVSLFPGTLSARGKARGVAIVLDAEEAKQKAVQWVAEELLVSLRSRGAAAEIFHRLEQAPAGWDCVIVATAGSSSGKQALAATGISLADVPEAVAVARGKMGDRRFVLATGSDVRGLVYAALELADRVNFAVAPLDELGNIQRTVEQPANRIRSIARAFVSEVEDKPWFNDREMWPRYLTMLATQRFNRFNLSLGIGYDFLRDVTDAYFLFAYPFLLSVPGYDVRVPELPDAERDGNLEMLKFISEETVARGLQFQLGIWMHGYDWSSSPRANYRIAGLSAQNHGPYCRDAVLALLRACPAISAITFRIHGESGVPEGSYDFWRMVFEGVAKCGRRVEIDLHAKGIDETMIDSALATGMAVDVAPKYWAEHLGMPYHQTEIRALERPRPGREGSGLMKLSSGSRSFLRYGYGDLLKENRRYTVMYRIWPGTQRLLLWGDPVTAAAHSRAFSFCGSAGVEIMEPLTFKGRRGSGIPGGRCAYAEVSLKPRWDWEKYLYTLRLWGRLMYNPESAPDIWQRMLRKTFAKGAKAVELALANASRILPIITTAHAPSAGNNSYWPEMYFNHSLIDAGRPSPYGDSPAPKVFGNVSPLDPQLFLRINDFAGELLKGEHSGKYTPIEVARWIEDYAEAAAKNLALAESKVRNNNTAEYRRMVVDLKIQIGLGRFFGAKFRSGVLYGLFEQSGDRASLIECIRVYRRARNAWAELAEQARNVYQADVTVGELPHLRGHWLDRLPAIDDDIALLEKRLEQTSGEAGNAIGSEHIRLCIQEILDRPRRPIVVCRHSPPARFRAGQPLEIELILQRSSQAVRLYYRHVNHGERFERVFMQAEGNHFGATIPAAYTNSPYPLQYYFEIRQDAQNSSLYPGFASNLANQPYFVVRHFHSETVAAGPRLNC
ncbi:MAG TPA: twin-arginine translocation signal domain-containing protein [Verrucomicrobiae bacterium]|nr:twin-arginine translocation signal domain-containing protein [Verrucomicrobiae bacterium]